MKKRKMNVKVGDVFELVVSSGFAHVQAIGIHPYYKTFWIVRVLDSICENSASDPSLIAFGTDSYTIVMGDLGFIEKEGLLRYVGRAEVPEKHQQWIPIIRSNAHRLPDGRHDPNRWLLDDGVNTLKVDTLTPEQEKLTYNALVPPRALAAHIDRGWNPNWEFQGSGAQEFLRPALADNKPRLATFYLFFAEPINAQMASRSVITQERSWTARIDELENDEDNEKSSYMLVFAISSDEFYDRHTLEDLDDRFEALASKFNGIYDGNEIPLQLHSS